MERLWWKFFSISLDYKEKITGSAALSVKLGGNELIFRSTNRKIGQNCRTVLRTERDFDRLALLKLQPRLHLLEV